MAESVAVPGSLGAPRTGEVSTMLELLERAIALVKDSGRPDLLHRLEQGKKRLHSPSTRILIIGEHNQGKSMLVNALVNAPVCSVGDSIAPGSIAPGITTVVSFGATPSVSLLVSSGGAGAARQPTVERQQVPPATLATRLAAGVNGAGRPITGVEVALPRGILRNGLSLIDSPGMLGSAPTALPAADALLLVSDAAQSYTEPEMQFLAQLLRLCPAVACVMTKTDLHPRWREVAQLNRAHLQRIDPRIALFPVSSELRMRAAAHHDPQLNAESGFSELIEYLRTDLVGKSERQNRRSIAQDLLSVSEHLSLSLQSELSALADPAGAPQMIADMEAARGRADDLRRRSARWQVTLGDGIADLIADMEHDLRDRMRSILRDAEEAIGESDPGPVWDDIVDWLESRIASAVSDTFIWTNERTEWLAKVVASHFSLDGRPMPTVRIDDADVLERVDFVPSIDSGHLSAIEKILIGMRGSYGGVLMVGLATGILGMALINPFSVAAGVLIGAKVYRDDQAARLKQRQAEAKSLVRRHIDDVVFQVGKQLKDGLRGVQRATRDHFVDLAEEYHRSLADSVAAAQNAARSAADAHQRTQEITAELARVESLRASAESLRSRAGEPASTQGPTTASHPMAASEQVVAK